MQVTWALFCPLFEPARSNRRCCMKWPVCKSANKLFLGWPTACSPDGWYGCTGSMQVCMLEFNKDDFT